MLSYLFWLNRTNDRKKNRKQKRKRRLTSIGPNSPRQPGPGTGPSSSSRQPGCCRRGEHAGDAWPPPASPRPHLHAWRRPEGHRIHSTPPWTSSPSPLCDFSTAPKHAGAPPWRPVATFLLGRCHLVQDARRRRLHRRVQAIEARTPEPVVLFTEPPLNPQELVVDSTTAAAPPASSSPSLQPG